MADAPQAHPNDEVLVRVKPGEQVEHDGATHEAGAMLTMTRQQACTTAVDIVRTLTRATSQPPKPEEPVAPKARVRRGGHNRLQKGDFDRAG